MFIYIRIFTMTSVFWWNQHIWKSVKFIEIEIKSWRFTTSIQVTVDLERFKNREREEPFAGFDQREFVQFVTAGSEDNGNGNVKNEQI